MVNAVREILKNTKEFSDSTFTADQLLVLSYNMGGVKTDFFKGGKDSENRTRCDNLIEYLRGIEMPSVRDGHAVQPKLQIPNRKRCGSVLAVGIFGVPYVRYRILPFRACGWDFWGSVRAV